MCEWVCFIKQVINYSNWQMFELVQSYNWYTPLCAQTRSQDKIMLNKHGIYVMFKLFPNMWIALENSLFHKCYSRVDSTPDLSFEPLPKKKKNLWTTKKIACVGWKHCLCKQCKEQTLVELKEGWESLSSLPSLLVLNSQSSFVPKATTLTWDLNSGPATSHSAQSIYVHNTKYIHRDVYMYKIKN